MADVECSETLEWYSQQKSPYVFAIANIFTKRSNQTPRHRSHLCHDIMKFSCGWTDLMYPVWWNQEKGLSSTAHVDHTEVLQCRHNIKTLTTVKYEKSCRFFFRCILVISNRSVGFGFVIWGLICRRGATHKAFRVERNCHHTCADADIVCKHCVFYCTKLSLHIVSRSATIICLGCFFKALKVSSSLYRDVKKKDFFVCLLLFFSFFYKNTHTTIHTQTDTPTTYSLYLCKAL